MGTKVPVSLSCYDHPTQCLLTSKPHDKRLSIGPDGCCFSTDNRVEWEQFTTVVCNCEKVKLKSVAHGHFLTSEATGNVFGTKDEGDPGSKWSLEAVENAGALLVYSIEHERLLSCIGGNHRLCTTLSDNEGNDEAMWKLELDTGELCFTSSVGCNKRLKCEPNGNLRTTNNWKGWEVFRFIEIGEGDVLISSWTHRSRYLCSNLSGDVFKAKKPLRGGWRWRVLKSDDAASARMGVIIKSVEHGRVLSCKDGRIPTTENTVDAHGLWCLESACGQKFFVSTTCHDKRIGTSNMEPYTTQNGNDRENWKVEKSGDGCSYTFYSPVHHKYLGSSADGKMFVTNGANDSCLWDIKVSEHGGYFIESHEHKRRVSCNNTGHLCTVSEQLGAGRPGALSLLCLPPFQVPK